MSTSREGRETKDKIYMRCSICVIEAYVQRKGEGRYCAERRALNGGEA